MQLTWLAVAIVATVAYHLVLKLTPAGANPFLSLAVTYAIVTDVFIALFFSRCPVGRCCVSPCSPSIGLRSALAAAIVFLDLGFLMLYRSGFDVSLGQVVTQLAAALLLLLLGVALFREKLSPGNAGGILLCVVGLWLISRR